MKKIGFVIPWFAAGIPGGAETALFGIVKQLIKRNISVEVLTTCVEKFKSDWNIDHYPQGLDNVTGIPVRRFKVRQRDTGAFDSVCVKLINNESITIDEEDIFLKEMVNSPDLYEYINKNKDDYSLFVFIPYMFGTTYYGCRVCPEKSVMIPCLHDESYAYMKRFKEVFKNLRGMIFLADPECELANSIYDLSGVYTETIGIGIDSDHSGNKERFRKKYGIKDDFILYAGRKEPGKNIDTLINYFTVYKKRNPGNLKMILIGSGEIHIPYQAGGDIIDLGFVSVEDKHDAYAACLLLCQPSQNESFSIVIMESWLQGRPVLVNENSSVTKNFAVKSNGGLFFSDFFEFEGCVDYYLSNSSQADLMGESGRDFVLKNFDWNVIAEKYIRFFEQVSA